MEHPNRREFLAAGAAAACVLCTRRLALADGLRKVDVGQAKDYPHDTIVSRWDGSDQFLLVRHGTQMYALSTVCPHKGGHIKIDVGGDSQFKCTRHGARFDLDGDVTRGPAKEGMFRIAISVDERGHIIVDTAQQLTADDPGAAISVS
jgi:nitrite reductase/ring-hydroxylating ferredoxin subunit